MLKFEQKTVISVDDWDQFVKDYYGKKYYSFQQQNGCQERGNYYINVDYIRDDEFFENTEIEPIINGPDMGVSLKAWIDKKDNFFDEPFDEHLFWQRNFYPAVEEIVLDLYNKGIIQEKSFTIIIDW